MAHRSASQILLQPAFVGAVVLLVLNDHVLKPAFGTWLTGKLSDVAGLFALTVFASAIGPQWRVTSAICITASFVWWKSPASSGVIHAWNSIDLWRIGRTPDYSDLIALPAIAAAVLYVSYRRRHRCATGAFTWPRRLATLGVAALSLGAFVATSYRSTVPFNVSYGYSGTAQQFVAELKAQGVTSYGQAELGKLELWIPSDFCFDRVYATIELQSTGDSTTLRLREITHRCARRRHEDHLLLEIFETRIVQPLQLRRVA